MKGRTLCFSTKKSVARVVFKCKLYLKNSIKLVKKKICRRPGEDFSRHPHFRKREYSFFGLITMDLFLNENETLRKPMTRDPSFREPEFLNYSR